MNLFDFYIPDWFFVALSLVILVVVLQRILWKPVNKVLDDRQKRIDDALMSAEDAREVVRQMEEDRARHEAELERQVVAKMREARERAGREYDRIVHEAEEKARQIVEAGEEKARKEYQNIMFESREAIVTLALGAASLVVESSMDTEKNRELVMGELRKAGVIDG